MFDWVDHRLLDAGLFFLTYLLANAAYQGWKSRRSCVVIRSITVANAWRGAALALAVVVCAVLMSEVTLLRGTLYSVGQGGNVLLGSVRPVAAAANPLVPFLPYVMPALLLAAMPRIVWYEERWFRRNAERTRLRRLLFPAAFGLSHLALGVPLFAALALVVAGVALQQIYLNRRLAGATRFSAMGTSAAVHITYNLVLLAVIVAVTAVYLLVERSP